MTYSSAISLQNISVRYGATSVLSGVSLDFAKSKITAIVGPNGCGKSTLLRTVNGLIKPHTGTVTIDGTPLVTLNRKQLAKRMSFLEQTPFAPHEMQILQLVKLGRYCHQNILQQWTADDQQAVETALDKAGVWDLRYRRIADVSGGQLQRAWWAMCLAQDADTLLLDEPINHLDMTYQLECLDNVKTLNSQRQKTVVMVLHDINLAMRYADYMVVMNADGQVYTQGIPHDIMTAKVFADVFGVQGTILTADAADNIPVFIPIHRICP